MTPQHFHTVLDTICWSQRALARHLACSDRLVRRWAAGSDPVPPEIAQWLERLYEAHKALPVPVWRQRHPRQS